MGLKAKRDKKILCLALFSIFIFISGVIPPAISDHQTINGIVFEDLNQDGGEDADEMGISDIEVSNGVDVTTTNESGEYELPNEGKFVFICTPSGYAPTTSWYSKADGECDFGIYHDPAKDTDNFTFVHMTDVHICKKDECLEALGSSARVDPEEYFGIVIEDINSTDPAFVIDTGDMIAEGNTATAQKAREWFDMYDETVSDLTTPLYHTFGNHELVGTNNEKMSPADEGYGKEIYEERYGPTYYSFDYGMYHFVILDAPHETPSTTVNMPEEQINWLRRDLSLSEDRKILVFYHEPISEWGRSSSEVLDLLREYDVDGLFCGHTHHDVLTNLGGIPEQQTGAVCGNWWSNKETPYGSPGGYRIIVVTEGGISTSYRGVAS